MSVKIKDPTKLCVNCKYYRMPYFHTGANKGKCTHVLNRDLVTGEPELTPLKLRYNGSNKCGLDGEWYKEKQ